MSLEKQSIRDKFRKEVLKRDHYKCVICKNFAKDAHHITNRNDIPNGGYVLGNGASLCAECHVDAEEGRISSQVLYKKIKSSKEMAFEASRRRLRL